MLYRTVKKNKDKLSILGFGCMRFPHKGLGIDEEKGEKLILSAIEKGINYFDTAVPYHGGKSEPFLGKILAKHKVRDKVKIATKLPHWKVSDKKEMHDVLNKQLKDLRTDRIDYYLVHNLNGNSWESAKKKGVISFLNEALKQKKILNAGFSYHGAKEDFKKVVDEFPWTFCQIQYNYLDTGCQAGTEGLKYASKKGLAVVIMEPLRGGKLAMKPPKPIKKIWATTEVKRSPVAWSLRWIWNHPEVTVILSGMTLPEHLDENVKIASEGEEDSLTKKEIKIVEEVANKFRKLMKVGCTGCQYCIPCPHGVNIPMCFDYYNHWKMFRGIESRFMYFMFNSSPDGKMSLASQCVNCGICVKKCPQNINIPVELQSVRKTMEKWYMKPAIWLFTKISGVKK
jgi:uncharacterized protein